MECHTRKDQSGEAFQCAGAATFRANVCKSVLPGNLELPPDKVKVFKWDNEFAAHHSYGKIRTPEQLCAEKMAGMNEMMRTPIEDDV
jgi:hypothetical protein